MTLHQLAIHAAVHHPGRLAVVDPLGSMSYTELDMRANALARHLRGCGVRRGDRVVLWADKSCNVLAATQAVLRLGAAHVPLDSSSPARRVSTVARDCGARVIVAAAEMMAELAGDLSRELVLLDLDADYGAGGEPVNEPVEPDELAYILYTSGSTGTPKGVCISHRNARAFVDWFAEELHASPEDRFANHAPLTFDLSVFDIYTAFKAGASVHLVPYELSYAPTQLVDFIHQHEISIWYSVPSALALMIRDGGLLERPAPADLRAVLFAGEPFAIDHVRRLAGWTNARLMNLYGPTETNVCTAHEVVPSDLDRDRPVPIGTATCGDHVWAQSADGRIAAPAEEGELLVDGPTVMLGYWGQEPHRGPYRTGDIVRVRHDGAFEYVGRRDHMVKVRGHRIELGEVEATLAAHPDVAEAVVVVSGVDVNSRLMAFVLPATEQKPGVLSLRRHCAQRMPRYMLVDEFVFVDELPRTRNGKVDRAALTAGVPVVETRGSTAIASATTEGLPSPAAAER